MFSKNIDRRSFTKAGIAIATGALIESTPFASAFSKGEELFVNSWGGSFTAAETEAFYKPFGAAEGVKVEAVTPVSFAKLKAQVQSGVYDFDLVDTNPIDYEEAKFQGLLEPVDLSVLDKSRLTPGIVEDFGVQSFALSTCLAYRTDKFKNNPPKTWVDFFDVERFPGNRAMFDRAYTALGIALVADGVPIKDIYPLDIDRAFAKLDKIKPHIKTWWNQTTQSQQLIRDGDVDILPMTNGRAQELADNGEPVSISWDGAELFMSYWMVPKGTPRAKLAWKFINFASQPKPASAFGARMHYGPANLKAFDFIAADVQGKMPTAPSNVAKSFEVDGKWLAPRMPELNERWYAWRAK